jgi:hypothetical protein
MERRAARSASAAMIAKRPIKPTIGNSLAVPGRVSVRPDVPTGCSGWLAAMDGADVTGAGGVISGSRAGGIVAGAGAGSGAVVVGAVVVGAVVVGGVDVMG